MISNRIVLKFLEAGQALGTNPLFYPVNALVRKLYLNGFTPLFIETLKRSTGIPSLKLIPRNSFQHGKRFNVFSSDLDYAIIIPEDADPNLIRSLISSYEFSRRFIPFIGEVELYESREWEAIQKLKDDHSMAIDLINEIRRLIWQENAYLAAPSTYHKKKALNSLDKKVKILSSEKSALPHGNLSQLNDPIKERLNLIAPHSDSRQKAGLYKYSSYIGAYIGTESRGETREIIFSFAELLRFVALLPDGNNVFPELVEEIEVLRTEAPIREAFLAIVSLELLVFTSVLRCTGRNDLGASEWKEQLQNHLNRHGDAFFQKYPLLKERAQS